MIGFSIFLFVIASIFTVISILIYDGKTSLIHEYHQEKVRDKKSYGRAFSKALLPMILAPVLSGIVALIDQTDCLALIAAGILIAGSIISVVLIICVQKNYNGGLF